jgi:hypothetical protein
VISTIPGVEDRVTLATQQWSDAYRNLRGDAGQDIEPRVLDQMDAVVVELRRRIGGTFTLGELEDVYGGSESWARHAIGERDPRPGWVRTASLATDAAFHLYARGARDYRP